MDVVNDFVFLLRYYLLLWIHYFIIMCECFVYCVGVVVIFEFIFGKSKVGGYRIFFVDGVVVVGAVKTKGFCFMIECVKF